MSLDRKRQFVEKTYEIMKKEGTEGIKIRRIASELNCTSTVIYRYFDNVDHLIALASIRYINEYILDYRNLITKPEILTDPLGLNLEMWKCLAGYAFRDIPVYENLFFGKYRNSLADLIYEYYSLFMTEEKKDFDGYSVSILFSSNMEDRDLVLLRRAEALGQLEMDAASKLSKIETFLFHGELLKYRDTYQEDGMPEKISSEFYALLTDLVDHYRPKISE